MGWQVSISFLYVLMYFTASLIRFLFENHSPAHVYYRWKLFSVLQVRPKLISVFYLMNIVLYVRFINSSQIFWWTVIGKERGQHLLVLYCFQHWKIAQNSNQKSNCYSIGNKYSIVWSCQKVVSKTQNWKSSTCDSIPLIVSHFGYICHSGQMLDEYESEIAEKSV